LWTVAVTALAGVNVNHAVPAGGGDGCPGVEEPLVHAVDLMISIAVCAVVGQPATFFRVIAVVATGVPVTIFIGVGVLTGHGDVPEGEHRAVGDDHAL
jgi:hypothetical protein